METELISVIVPVYNVERYLRRCVDSILHQTYRNLEAVSYTHLTLPTIA